MQDDDRPLLWLEAAETPLELVAIGDRRDVIDDGRQIRRIGDLDIKPTSTRATHLIGARVHQESMQPRVEAIGIAEGRKVAPGTEEGVLDGVRRPIRVPEDEPGCGVETSDRGACQLGEGVMIALPRTLHEFSPHAHSPQAVARLGRPRSLSMALGICLRLHQVW